jgi:Ca-activated chloride channel family protein
MDPLRYQSKAPSVPASSTGEIAFLRMRYKLPAETQSRLIERPVTDRDKIDDVHRASGDLRFAAAVAGFGQLLRNDPYMKQFGFADVAELAGGAKGPDAFGYRSEFLQLVKLAEALPALPTLDKNGQGGPAE